MGFFILFGVILMVISLVVRFNMPFKVNENATCLENEKRTVRENKINFYVFLGLGVIFIITGIILGVLGI